MLISNFCVCSNFFFGPAFSSDHRRLATITAFTSSSGAIPATMDDYQRFPYLMPPSHPTGMQAQHIHKVYPPAPTHSHTHTHTHVLYLHTQITKSSPSHLLPVST